MAIIIHLDVMLAKRKMSVTDLSDKVGITMANISILKMAKQKRSFLPSTKFVKSCIVNLEILSNM